ncbi:MAG: isoprenylcysteine carboxylmethyltransferase family protein [Pseudobutyrivibrio ruminis]|nr:isoprenylcysteine carboxylmethyltransferase family protein [Pseudobutyrivibrio ruminis]
MAKNNLLQSALIKFFAGVILVGLLLFIPAGSFAFWQAWLLMGVLFIPMFVAGLILMKINPALLRKRLNAKEEQMEQKEVVLLSGVMFLASFILAGLNFRVSWLVSPEWVTIVGTVIFLLAYALYAEVLRENEYLSRTVEVQEGQKLVDTGLYGIVRHPMYMATVLLFLSMPIILGSIPSFVVMLMYIPIIAKRIHNEEKVLEDGLDGYKQYKERVKYRIIPFVW